MEPESLFKLPMHNYSSLEKSMICYVDALGSSYLMPCLCQNPTQTQAVRNLHYHDEIFVLQDTIRDTDENDSSPSKDTSG